MSADEKRVVSDPDKIRAMGPVQAWDNYMAAMVVVTWARRIRRPASEKAWDAVARQSLDQHFATTDELLGAYNARGAWTRV
jgi:hypothetical protein